MQRFSRCVLAFWLAVLCVVVSWGPGGMRSVQAQPPDDQLGESLGFVILFPQLRNLPPPTWFQPGVRVSYRSISANFQGGGAGGGVVQYDVVGLEAGWAMVSANSLMDLGSGTLIPAGPAPKVGLPAVGEFWIHPAVLVGAEAVANPNLSVTRLTKTFMNQNFEIVRFQSETAGQSGVSRTVWEFDTGGGLLMFYSQSLDGVSASQLEVLNFRTVNNLPTQGATAPNWVRPGAQLDFTGTQTQSIPGAGNITASFAVSNQIVGATSTWSVQAQNTFLNNTPMGSTATATGIGQIFGGLWLPPQALNRIVAQETLIDQDPVTGAQLTVGRTQSNEIFLREVNQAYETILFYDPNLGAPNGVFQRIAGLTGETQNDLRRTGGSDLSQLNTLPPLSGAPEPPGSPIDTDPATDQEVEIELPTTVLRLEIPGDFVAEPVNTTVNVVLGPPSPPSGATFVGDPFALVVTSQATGDPIISFERPVTLRVQLPAVGASGESSIQTGVEHVNLSHTNLSHAHNDGSEPTLYHRTEAGWQPLDSVYDAQNQTVTASHNRSGTYAVFQADPTVTEPEDEEPEDEEPEDEEPEDEEPEDEEPGEDGQYRTFLPALQR